VTQTGPGHDVALLRVAARPWGWIEGCCALLLAGSVVRVDTHRSDAVALTRAGTVEGNLEAEHPRMEERP
jgi:hypothetical protein